MRAGHRPEAPGQPESWDAGMRRTAAPSGRTGTPGRSQRPFGARVGIMLIEKKPWTGTFPEAASASLLNKAVTGSWTLSHGLGLESGL